jgi:hypothetical protein
MSVSATVGDCAQAASNSSRAQLRSGFDMAKSLAVGKRQRADLDIIANKHSSKKWWIFFV